MIPRRRLGCLARWIGALAIVLIAPATQAEETEGYGFAAAAQELSQPFWPAETANACGWASREEVLKFERFSLRFLAAIALFSAQPRRNCANRTVNAAEERHQQFRAVHLRGLLARAAVQNAPALNERTLAFLRKPAG